MIDEEQVKSSALEALSQSRANALQINQLATSVEKFVAAVNEKLDKLDAKLDGKTQTKWPVIWSALGVCAMIIIPAITADHILVDAKISALRELVTSLKENQAAYQIDQRSRTEFLEKNAKDDVVYRAHLWDNYVATKIEATSP